jgi:hypothetical protein
MTERVLKGVWMIGAERSRQLSVEGWTPEHDTEHTTGELTRAARCYADAALTAVIRPDASEYHRLVHHEWPWHQESWKPSNDPIRNLVKAGALIAAEIDRLQAAAAGTDG